MREPFYLLWSSEKTQVMRLCKSILNLTKQPFLWSSVMKAWVSVVFSPDSFEHFVLMVRTYVSDIIG